MPPEETPTKSPLDKPLNELTEDDISQLTREDCRRYLKQKGMRRPSWNKSQAIQQVISLKTLLETPPDTDASSNNRLKKLYIPRPRLNDNIISENTSNNPSKATSADEEMSESAEEMMSSYPRKEAEKPDVCSHVPVDENDLPSPRITDSSNVPVGQMTIFYCGRVNVYDDVPVDKAQALMQLAASPVTLPQEVLFDHSLAVQSRCRLQDISVKPSPDSAVRFLPNMQSVKMTETTRLRGEECKLSDENPAEAPTSRKASVQRYLEKRKDRFKSKKKVGLTSTASLDIYLNHQMGQHIPSEQSSRSDPCSPQLVRPPKTPIKCNSMEDSLTRDAILPSGHKDTGMRK